MVTQQTPRPDGQCRYCGKPAYLTDEEGPAHPCCAFWIGQLSERVCRSCVSSAASQRQRRSGSARVEKPSTAAPEHGSGWVLRRLEVSRGSWVDVASLGGDAVHLKELVAAGHPIEKRPIAPPESGWQVRLA